MESRLSRCAVLTLAVVAISASAVFAQEAGETFGRTAAWLPEEASSVAPVLDRLFNFILYLTIGVNIAVFVVMAIFLWAYRARPGRRATFIHGSHKLEMVWTLIPAVILVMITTVSQTSWSKIKTPFESPDVQDVKSGEAVEMRVVGMQFKWYFQYPGADGVLGRIDPLNIPAQPMDDAQRIGLDRSDPAAADDFVSVVGVIPVNRRVYVHLNSLDVIHSFYLPNFRIKHDAVPGLNGRVWLEATKTSGEVIGRYANDRDKLRVFDLDAGEYVTISDNKPFDLVCAELCGQGHYTMRGTFYVVTDGEYRRFIEVNQRNVSGGGSDDGGY